jgi:hypothetical protein
MRAFEIQQIKQAKKVYYTAIGIRERDSRSREQSLARSAFVCAFRNYATLQELGHITSRDHSTLIYSLKEHEARLGYDDYRKMYETACFVRDKTNIAELEAFDINSLHSEIKRLNDLITELIQYKELYLTLKKTFDEFSS